MTTSQAPAHVGDLMAAVLDCRQDWRFKLLSSWRDIVGPLADRVALENICDDMLVLSVCDACWMHELYAMSDFLLASINKTLDRPHLKKLRFKRAALRTSGSPKIPSGETSVQQRVCGALNEREERVLSSLKDRELASALRGFLERCYCNRGFYENSIHRCCVGYRQASVRCRSAR